MVRVGGNGGRHGRVPRRLVEGLCGLVLPRDCVACRLPGADLCADCARALIPIGTGCERCGHPEPFPVARCAECVPFIVSCRQAVEYRVPAPDIVAGLKDGRRRALARVAARLVADLVEPVGGDAAPLVPVPLSRARMRERGFNQARLLADELGVVWGRPVRELLVRASGDAHQRGATARERRHQVANVFAVAPAAVVPTQVVLVDDVHTTGATLSACARALRRAGARDVHAVTFARVVRR